MTEDEVTAFHEAAHAVIAASSEWTRIHGPVTLYGEGAGDVVMATNREAIVRAITRDPGFDRDLPRLALIRAILAGPLAERMLVERGLAAAGEAELAELEAQDYALAAEQIAKLNAPPPDLLARLEAEVRAALAEPATWSAIERFAAILRERRRLELDEATAILVGLGIATKPPSEAAPWLGLAALLTAAILFAVIAMS